MPIISCLVFTYSTEKHLWCTRGNIIIQSTKRTCTSLWMESPSFFMELYFLLTRSPLSSSCMSEPFLLSLLQNMACLLHPFIIDWMASQFSLALLTRLTRSWTRSLVALMKLQQSGSCHVWSDSALINCKSMDSSSALMRGSSTSSTVCFSLLYHCTNSCRLLTYWKIQVWRKDKFWGADYVNDNRKDHCLTGVHECKWAHKLTRLFLTFVNMSRFSKTAIAAAGILIWVRVWIYFTSFKTSVSWGVKGNFIIINKLFCFNQQKPLNIIIQIK